MTFALQQALHVSMRCLTSKAILKCDRPGVFLVRAPRREGPEIVWSDQHLEGEPYVKNYVSFYIDDEVSVKRILASGKKSRGTWEADTFFTPFPVQEKNNERPFYPKVFLIMDTSRGLVIGYEMMADLEAEGHRCVDRIVDLVGKQEIPSRIVVECDETYYLLKEACHQLNIPLKKVEQLKYIPQAREDMFNR